jgi:arsenite oxidase small subunit
MESAVDAKRPASYRANMDRRNFLHSCSSSAGAACLSTAALLPEATWAADAKPKSYSRVLLTDERGDAFKASSLKAQANYVFHYPFEATPVFLLDLGKPVAGSALKSKSGESYQWPGGVGKNKSIVAFSAICAHQLVYPTQQLSFISFRKGTPVNAKTPNAGADLIHCCADHSQYDPAQGAKVLSGPASQPLCAVLLEHNAKDDTLSAHATLGGELFDEFFKKYEAKLSIEVGSKAKNTVSKQTVVRELEKFCRNPVKC